MPPVISVFTIVAQLHYCCLKVNSALTANWPPYGCQITLTAEEPTSSLQPSPTSGPYSSLMWIIISADSSYVLFSVYPGLQFQFTLLSRYSTFHCPLSPKVCYESFAVIFQRAIFPDLQWEK